MSMVSNHSITLRASPSVCDTEGDRFRVQFKNNACNAAMGPPSPAPPRVEEAATRSDPNLADIRNAVPYRSLTFEGILHPGPPWWKPRSRSREGGQSAVLSGGCRAGARRRRIPPRLLSTHRVARRRHAVLQRPGEAVDGGVGLAGGGQPGYRWPGPSRSVPATRHVHHVAVVHLGRSMPMTYSVTGPPAGVTVSTSPTLRCFRRAMVGPRTT